MIEKIVKTITLRRDGKGPLRFDGLRIGDARRRFSRVTAQSAGFQDALGNPLEISYEVSARLFKTTGDIYVAGIELYNRTDEEYVLRRSWVAKVLAELLSQIRADGSLKAYLDDDLLAELFEDTELGGQFVEKID